MNARPDKSHDDKTSSVFASVVILVLSLVILAFHANYYLPFVADDSLISLRYAERLSQGQGLTWTDGQPVEGYSNLLWILLLLPGAWLGYDLVTVARVLGFVSIGLLIAAVIYYTHAVRLMRGAPGIVGTLTIVAAAPAAVWSIGGLEEPLIACLLAWALALLMKSMTSETKPARYVWGASLCLALASITRLDGILFTGAAVLGTVILKGINRTAMLMSFRLAILPALFYLAQLVFRLIYYGEWVANVALVKISPSWQHIGTGASYLGEGIWALSPISEIAIAFLILAVIRWPRIDTELRNRITFLGIPALLWGVYLVFIGGDVFPAWRHMLPLLAIMALTLAEGVDWLLRRARSASAKIAFYIFCIVCFALFVPVQFAGEENQRAVDERWEWDGQVIGLMLKKGFGQAQPLLAVSAAGCLPYWSGLPSLDMLGLNDYHIPRHAPDNFGQGWIGHELGDGDYVLSREPDLVIFCLPSGSTGACFKSGKEMLARPEFCEKYSPVTFEGRIPRKHRSLIWVRRYSPKIGIQKTDTSVSIPSYLINALGHTVAYLTYRGDFAISISPDEPGGLDNLLLPAGNWSVNVDPATSVRVTLLRPNSSDVILDAITPCKLELRDTSSVDIVLRPLTTQRQEIRELNFRHVPG